MLKQQSTIYPKQNSYVEIGEVKEAEYGDTFSVGLALNRLEKQAHELNEKLHELAERIKPILLEMVSDSKLPMPSKPPMCAVSQNIESVSDVLSDMTQYTQYLIDCTKL